MCKIGLSVIEAAFGGYYTVLLIVLFVTLSACEKGRYRAVGMSFSVLYLKLGDVRVATRQINWIEADAVRSTGKLYPFLRNSLKGVV